MKNITLQDQTYEKLREMIIKTELSPGQKISEVSLMELLDVGRTPIRESLKQLKKQNLVHTYPQSGTYVSKIDMKHALHSRFVRQCIEKEVMIELTVKLNDENEKRLRDILNKQKQDYELRNMSGYHDLDDQFHKTCYEIVGKETIWEWIKEFNVHLDRFRWLFLKEVTFDYNEILKEHEGLLDAMREKNTEKVGRLIIDHIHFDLALQGDVIEKNTDFFTEDSIDTPLDLKKKVSSFY